MSDDVNNYTLQHSEVYENITCPSGYTARDDECIDSQCTPNQIVLYFNTSVPGTTLYDAKWRNATDLCVHPRTGCVCSTTEPTPIPTTWSPTPLPTTSSPTTSSPTHFPTPFPTWIPTVFPSSNPTTPTMQPTNGPTPSCDYWNEGPIDIESANITDNITLFSEILISFELKTAVDYFCPTDHGKCSLLKVGALVEVGTPRYPKIQFRNASGDSNMMVIMDTNVQSLETYSYTSDTFVSTHNDGAYHSYQIYLSNSSRVLYFDGVVHKYFTGNLF